ncbi:hypothetical protein LXL04_035187 [Taraxacum kok-saghyz]
MPRYSSNHISTRVAPLFSKKRDQNSVPFFSAEYDLRVHLKWRVRRPSRCSYASPRHIIRFSKNIEQSSIKMKTRLKGHVEEIGEEVESGVDYVESIVGLSWSRTAGKPLNYGVIGEEEKELGEEVEDQIWKVLENLNESFRQHDEELDVLSASVERIGS